MLKIILTFGAKGDYNKIRAITKKHHIFYPLYRLYESFHNAILPIENEIDGNIFFPHGPLNVMITRWAKIGRNCTILQNVTIAADFINKKEKGGAPIIKDNVFIGTGAIIVGKVTIRNNVKIGAGCIVVTDIPDDSTVVMHKPRILTRK